MSEIIDVLTPLPIDCPYFTVDNTQPYVEMYKFQRTPNAAYEGWLHRAGGASVFSSRDNVLIATMGIWFPEAFSFASPNIAGTDQSCAAYALGLQKDLTQGVFFIDQFGVTGIQIPLENYEMPIGIYIDITKSSGYPAGTNYHLYGILRGIEESTPMRPRVSMIGVPDSLNGTKQVCVPFVKVIHTIPLS